MSAVSKAMVARVEAACRVLHSRGETFWASGDLFARPRDDTFGLAITSTIRSLRILCERGVLERRGRGRATVYVPGPQWSAS